MIVSVRLKAARLDNIFLTRMSWDNVGGLSGRVIHRFDLTDDLFDVLYPVTSSLRYKDNTRGYVEQISEGLDMWVQPYC